MLVAKRKNANLLSFIFYQLQKKSLIKTVETKGDAHSKNLSDVSMDFLPKEHYNRAIPKNVIIIGAIHNTTPPTTAASPLMSFLQQGNEKPYGIFSNRILAIQSSIFEVHCI